MSKFILFSLIWWLTGNPFIAIIVILILLYIADRRFLGVTPSIAKPIARSRRLGKLKNQLALSPHDSSLKLDIARVLIEKNNFAQAAAYLEQIKPVFTDSADVSYALGLCCLKLGRLAEGERLILEALEINPRVGYGDPYLRLGEAFAGVDKTAALGYLERFREANSSSCEAYYRMGKLFAQLGRHEAAGQAFREAAAVYRSLPRYKRRSERKWALLCALSRR